MERENLLGTLVTSPPTKTKYESHRATQEVYLSIWRKTALKILLSIIARPPTKHAHLLHSSSQNATTNSGILVRSVPKLPRPLARSHTPRPFLPLILSLWRQIHKDLLSPYLPCASCETSQCCLLRHGRPSATRWISPVQEMSTRQRCIRWRQRGSCYTSHRDFAGKEG